MSFGEAFRSGLRNYAQFSGRARRSEFWWFALAVMVINMPLVLLVNLAYFALFTPVYAGAIRGDEEQVEFADLYWGPVIVTVAVALLVWLLLLLPTLAVESRRLHDMGQPGRWVWLNFVGLGLVPLIMCILEPQRGTNEYGSDPREAAPAR